MNQIGSKIKNLLETETIKQASVTSVGTVINGVLGAFFYIALARILGPIDFGILTISIAFLTFVADVSDIGINTGLVRFVATHLSQSSSKAFSILKISLESKLVIWLILMFLSPFLSYFFANFIFQRPELTIYMGLSFVGVGGALLFSYATSTLQSLQKFKLWSLMNIFTNAIRLFSIFLLIGLSQLTTLNSFLVYIAFPFLGFFLSLTLLPIGHILKAKNDKHLFLELFHFNKWVAISTFIAALSSRLDIFIATRLLSPTDLGLYSAAVQLTFVIPQLIGALSTVAAPKFAQFPTKIIMTTYLKKFQWMVLGLSGVCLVGIPLSFFLIPLFLGSQYILSIPLFIVLLIAMLIFLISVPVHSSIFYYFARPDIFVRISLLHLLVVGLLGYVLASSFGGVGLAFSVLIGMLINLSCSAMWVVLQKDHKNEKD